MEDTNGLLSFNWEEGSDSFFNEVEEPKKEEKKEVKEKEDSTKENLEEEIIIEEELFDEEEKEKQEIIIDNNSYKNLFKDLKNQGIFKHIDIEEEEDLDEDKFLELQEEEYETEVSERLKAWATEELDEDAKAFIKFKREGGNTQDFFEVFKKNEEFPIGEIEDEDYQDDIIRFQLKKEGWDKDEIEDRLEFLTTSGKKQKVAEKYSEKIEAEKEKEKQELLIKVEEQRKFAKQQEEDFKSNIRDFLETNEKVKDFKLSNMDKNKIFNFITKKEHKISNEKVITNFQKNYQKFFKIQVNLCY